MSSSCTSILMGVTPSVSEIPLLSKTAKFPFRPMGYSPSSSKILIDQNRLKKFMYLGIDVTCMHTNFGGRGLSGFGDIATFKTAKFPFRPMGYSPWSSEILINRNQLKKFMQVGIDVKFMYIDLMGVTPSFSEILLLSKTAKFPFQPMGYSPWSSEILINRNRLKKFMQVGIDVKFMYIDFDGRDPFSFRDTATLKNGQISLSTHGL